MEIEKKFDDICGNLQFRKKEEEICKYEKFYGYICNFPNKERENSKNTH